MIVLFHLGDWVFQIDYATTSLQKKHFKVNSLKGFALVKLDQNLPLQVQFWPPDENPARQVGPQRP
jgi:hypothetical protein